MYEIITFDCYGTLIDWEGGITDAVDEAANNAGVDVDRSQIMPTAHRTNSLADRRAPPQCSRGWWANDR
jgi:FMN phosphatase YigB (HAD superfamily)